MKTASAMFDTFNDANNAVRDLMNSGFTKSEVSLVSSNREKHYDNYFDTEGRYRNDATVAGSTVTGGSVVHSDIDARNREMSGTSLNDRTTDEYDRDAKLSTGEGAAAGAGVGAALGGLGGALMGLGLLVIPGVGPALAAGALASALVGAGIGGAAGGIAGALANSGIPEEDANMYAEGVRRGGHLVVVTAEDAKISNAQDILYRHNPVSMKERADSWRKEGWDRFDPNAQPYDPDRPASSIDDASRSRGNSGIMR
jgi:hypothetical protein